MACTQNTATIYSSVVVAILRVTGLFVNKLQRQSSGLPTIADVARLAGVSPMTISRVINGEKNVKQSTRETVLAKIAELNYSPNPAARSLAGAELCWIGLLYSNPSSAYLSEFLIGSLEQASRVHVQLVVAKCNEGELETDAARRLIANGLDGLILAPPLCDIPEMRDLLSSEHISAVAVAPGPLSDEISGVRIDDRGAAAAMTRHLIGLGHRRIGFVVGNPDQSASSMRTQGYRDAMIEAGLPIEEDLIVQGYFTYRSGLEAGEALLALREPPTAIFASNDDMAAATINVAHRQGYNVPADLTVCGFDDTESARSIWPELTTIRQPVADMSRAAVDLLVFEIRERRAGRKAPIVSKLLDFELIRRGSDAPPKVFRELRTPN
jgi:LacI family transcriptional regulator